MVDANATRIRFNAAQARCDREAAVNHLDVVIEEASSLGLIYLATRSLQSGNPSEKLRLDRIRRNPPNGRRDRRAFETTFALGRPRWSRSSLRFRERMRPNQDDPRNQNCRRTHSGELPQTWGVT